MKGITFVEIILVVALISILSLMGPVFYSRFLLQNEVANVTDQLVGSLRKAQIYAMESKQSSGWSVNYSSSAHEITLYKGAAPYVAGALDEKFKVNTSVSISGITDVSFAKATGLPTPGSGLTITISSSGNNSKTVTINSQGVATR